MAILGMMIVAAAPLPAQKLPIETALDRIRQKVDIFESRLPDFVCRELIHSRTEADPGGVIGAQSVVESVFTGRQKHASFGGTLFAEERKVEKINGARTSANELPKGMFRVGGGYSSVLIQVFGKKGQDNYSFTWGNGEQGPEGSVEIDFATRKSNLRVKGSDGAHAFNGTGRAWFDSSTWDIIRLEEGILPANGNPDNALTIAVEFEPFSIGDIAFRMPRNVTASAHRTVQGRAQHGVYEAEYTDYRKYGSSSTITFDHPE